MPRTQELKQITKPKEGLLYRFTNSELFTIRTALEKLNDELDDPYYDDCERELKQKHLINMARIREEINDE